MRWSRLRVISELPNRSDAYPLEFWLGRGKPLNPDFEAAIRRSLLRKLKPRELQLPPRELLFNGEVEILERTVIRNWMSQWLRWLSWYHTVASNPETPLRDILVSAPICARSWKRSEFDPKRFQLGLLWHLYDAGAHWDLSTTNRYLFPVSVSSPGVVVTESSTETSLEPNT